MLQRKPEDRPTLASLLKDHPFFHPKGTGAGIKKGLRDGFDAMGGRLNQIKEKVDEVKEIGVKVEKGLSGGFDAMGRRLNQIEEKMDEALRKLVVQFKVMGTLLSSVDGLKLAPNFICFLPETAFNTTGNSWWTKVTSFNSHSIFNNTVQIFFIDPIRMSLAPTNASKEFPMGQGFKLKSPKEWATKAMPYLKLGLTYLKVAHIAGRLVGLPAPNIDGVVGSWIDGQLEELSKLSKAANDYLINQPSDKELAKSLHLMVRHSARIFMNPSRCLLMSLTNN
mmetsp:Transcript_9855/g.20829  ORF Transcript_9855/g.20829 Transcript_9855/m.20829 type:complete len:280 (+) Transcript_9855:599-1438(+)